MTAVKIVLTNENDLETELGPYTQGVHFEADGPRTIAVDTAGEVGNVVAAFLPHFGWVMPRPGFKVWDTSRRFKRLHVQAVR